MIKNTKKEKIDNAITEFFQDNICRGLAKDSMRYYNQNIKAFQKWLQNKVKTTSQLNEDVYKKYVLSLSARLDNNTSINTMLRAVRRFINFCIEKKYCKRFETALKKEEEKIKPALSQTEAEAFLEKSLCQHTKGSIASLLLFTTGMRSKTLRSIKVKDINFSEEMVFLKALKDKKQNILPLPDRLLSHIRVYIELNQLQSHDYIIANGANNMYDASGLYKLIKRHLHSCGVKTVGVHMFRHTFGKFMSLNGSDSISLMRCLCHKTVKQSQKYVAIYGNELRGAMEKYNPLINLAEKIYSKNVAKM